VFALSSPAPAHAQTESVIHGFRSTNGFDGVNPFGNLVADKNGALYGTTDSGGKYGFGAVYKLLLPTTQGGTWKETILYSFTGTNDGLGPTGSIVLANGGKIYGTTQAGGQYGDGTVYELIPPTQAGTPWTETILYSFYGSTDPIPDGVTAGPGGRLYGTTVRGGRYGVGTVFAVSPPTQPEGPWIEQTLHTFNGGGAVPEGYPTSLVVDASGSLYGATSSISENNDGVVFQLSPPSDGHGAWTEQILYAFTGEEGDGLVPSGGLILDSSGALYGNTIEGGEFGQGVVYQLSPPAGQGGAWTERVLYSFGVGGDSANPIASLVFDGAGALYGVSENGGTDSCAGDYYYCGTVFKVSPPSIQGGAWTEQVLHSFTGGSDGAYVQNPLLVVGAKIYGTTVEGGTGFCENQNGPSGCGTVFQITQP
jgi:uncharacterized repeat protein (TIGR03803 family)